MLAFSITMALVSVVVTQHMASDVIFFGPAQSLIFFNRLCFEDSAPPDTAKILALREVFLF